MNIKKKILKSLPLFQLLMAVLCIVYISNTVDLENTGMALSSTDFQWLLYAFSLLLLAILLQAFRWKSLDYDLDIPLIKYIYYVLLGYVTSFFLPSSYSGDAVKAVLFGKKYGNIGKNIARISVARGIGLLLQLILAVIGLWYYTKENNSFIGTFSTTILFLILLFSFIITIAVVLLYKLPQIKTKSWYKEFLFIVSRPRVLCMLCLQTILIQTSTLFAGVFVFLALNYYEILSFKLLLFPVLNLLSALPIIVNGIGVRESIGVWVFSTLGGVKEHVAIAAMLECYLLSVIVILLGALWIGVRKWYALRRKM
jgi:uncharacterized membrane protein YbhN (UPF0104 family)